MIFVVVCVVGVVGIMFGWFGRVVLVVLMRFWLVDCLLVLDLVIVVGIVGCWDDFVIVLVGVDGIMVVLWIFVVVGWGG